MENLYIETGKSYDTFLGLYIRDLEGGRNYEEFRIALYENEEWFYVNKIENSDKTETVIFEGLNAGHTYKFKAQYKLDGTWVDIQDCSFQSTIPNPDRAMPIFRQEYLKFNKVKQKVNSEQVINYEIKEDV